MSCSSGKRGWKRSQTNLDAACVTSRHPLRMIVAATSAQRRKRAEGTQKNRFKKSTAPSISPSLSFQVKALRCDKEAIEHSVPYSLLYLPCSIQARKKARRSIKSAFPNTIMSPLVMPAPISAGSIRALEPTDVDVQSTSNLPEQENSLTRLQEKRRQVALRRKKLEQRMADARTGSSRSLTVDNRGGSSRNAKSINRAESTRSLASDNVTKSTISKSVTSRSADITSPKRTSKAYSTKTPDASPIPIGHDDETPTRKNTVSGKSSGSKKSSSLSEPSQSLKAILSPPPLTGPKTKVSSKIQELSASFSSFTTPIMPNQESKINNGSNNKKKTWTPKVKSRSSSFSPGNGPSAPESFSSPKPGFVKKRAQSFSGSAQDAAKVAAAATRKKSSDQDSVKSKDSAHAEPDYLSPRSNLEKRRSQVAERRKKLQEQLSHAKEVMSPVATIQKVEEKQSSTIEIPLTDEVKPKPVPRTGAKSAESKSLSSSTQKQIASAIVSSCSSSEPTTDDDTFDVDLLERKGSNHNLRDTDFGAISDPKAVYFNMAANESYFSLGAKEVSVSSILTEDTSFSPKSTSTNKKKVSFTPARQISISSLLSADDASQSSSVAVDHNNKNSGGGPSRVVGWTPVKQLSNISLLSNDSQHSTQRAGKKWTPGSRQSSSNSLGDSQHSGSRAGRSWTPSFGTTPNSVKKGKTWSKQLSGKSLLSNGEDTSTTAVSTIGSSLHSPGRINNNMQMEEDSMTSFDFSNREEDEGVIEVASTATKSKSSGVRQLPTKHEWNNASWSVRTKDALLHRQKEQDDAENSLEDSYHCHRPTLVKQTATELYDEDDEYEYEYIEEEYDSGDEEFFEDASTEEADQAYLRKVQSDDDDDNDSLESELEVVIEEEWYEVEEEILEVETDDEWIGEEIGEDDKVLSRKEYKKAVKALSAHADKGRDRDAASIIIQSSIRGMLQRKQPLKPTTETNEGVHRDSAATIIQSSIRGMLQRKESIKIAEDARIAKLDDELDDEIEDLEAEVAAMELKLKETQEAAVDEILALKEAAAKKMEEFRSMNKSLSELSQDMVNNHPEIIEWRAKNKKVRDRNKQLDTACSNCRTNIVRLTRSNDQAVESIKGTKHGFFRNSVRNQQLIAQVKAEENRVQEFHARKRMRIEDQVVETKNRDIYLNTVNKVVHLALRRLPEDEHHAKLYADIEKTAAVCLQLDTDRRRGKQ